MTRPEANAVLDLAKAGGTISQHAITMALGVTGDLAPCRINREREPYLPPETEWRWSKPEHKTA